MLAEGTAAHLHFKATCVVDARRLDTRPSC